MKNYGLISIGLAVLAGGVAAFGYYDINHTVPAVVATQAIPANQTVTPQEVTVTQVPAAYAKTANLVTSLSLVNGKMLIVPAVPGEPINLQMLNTASDLQAIVNQYAQKVGPGYLATVPGTGAWAQVVQPGADIAIEQGSVLLQPIHVIAAFTPTSGGGGPVWFVFVPQAAYSQFSQINWNSTGTQIMLYSQNGGRVPIGTTGGTASAVSNRNATTTTASGGVPSGTSVGASGVPSNRNATIAAPSRQAVATNSKKGVIIRGKTHP